jgi:hypothetical protein
MKQKLFKPYAQFSKKTLEDMAKYGIGHNRLLDKKPTKKTIIQQKPSPSKFW